MGLIIIINLQIHVIIVIKMSIIINKVNIIKINQP